MSIVSKRAIFSALFPALVVACGSEVRVLDDPSGDGGAGGDATMTTGSMSTGAGGNSAQPPPPPLDGMPTGPGRQYVVQWLWVGDAEPFGSPNPQAWRGFGYDLDGLPGDAGPHCQPASGANPAKVFSDGAAGRDNAFGNTWLTIFTGLFADFGGSVNERLQLGEGNLLLDLPRVGQGDHLGSEGRIYVGSPTPFTPAFDGSDPWRATAESLGAPPDLGSARYAFNGYVSQNVWVSTPGPLEVPLFIGDLGLSLPLSTAVVTLDLGTGRGVLSGVIDVEVFLERFREFAGALDPNLCSGTTVAAIEDELRKASDIMLDGTQDPNRVCNGVSIGMEFDVADVQIVGAASVAPTPTPNCP